MAKPGRGDAKRAACPLCGRPTVAAWRPFCSKTCADIDLGRWLGGAYAIPGPAAPEDPAGGPASQASEPDAPED